MVSLNTARVRRKLPFGWNVGMHGEEGRDYMFSSCVQVLTGGIGYEDLCGFDGGLTVPATEFKLFVASTGTLDTTQVIKIHGLDDNLELQYGYATLNGQTKVEVKDEDGDEITWRMAHLAEIMGDADITAGKTVWIAEDDTFTLGVPQTQAKKKLNIPATSGESPNTAFMVPAGKRGLMVMAQYGLVLDASHDPQAVIKTQKPGEIFKIHALPNTSLLGAGSGVLAVGPSWPAGTIVKMAGSASASEFAYGQLSFLLWDV